MRAANWTNALIGPLCALVLTPLLAGQAAAVPVQGPPPAVCQLDISPSSPTWSINGYDPFSASPLSNTYSVLFHNSGGADCDFYVDIRTDNEVYGLSGSAGQLLPYTLLDSTNNLNVTPFSGVTPANARPHLHLAAGAQQQINYAFIIDLAQLPTDGDFQQQLLVSAETVAGPAINDKPIELTVNVAPSAVLSLRGAFRTGSSGAFIELGKLQPGPATTLLQLYVQSTGGYRVDAESANKGQLKLGGAEWAIPYTLSIGGHLLDLSSNAYFDAARLSVARQDLLPVGFIIGDTSQRRAGRYEDVITLSVTAE